MQNNKMQNKLSAKINSAKTIPVTSAKCMN